MSEPTPVSIHVLAVGDHVERGTGLNQRVFDLPGGVTPPSTVSVPASSTRPPIATVTPHHSIMISSGLAHLTAQGHSPAWSVVTFGALAISLLGAAYCRGMLTRAPFRRLLVMTSELHLTVYAFALKLLLEYPESWSTLSSRTVMSMVDALS